VAQTVVWYTNGGNAHQNRYSFGMRHRGLRCQVSPVLVTAKILNLRFSIGIG
ncbi:hypothetical protein AVEN_2783-1, partial [Araneus ventricosus]